MRKRRERQMTRFCQFDLKAGLGYIRAQPFRKLEGHVVEKTNTTRHQMFSKGKTACVNCGLQGTHFHIERAVKDKVMPHSINLYAFVGGREVMLTHDHIVPRSLGGSDHPDNAQCMCERCNFIKGNRMSLAELVTASVHPHPLNIFRLPKSVQELAQIEVHSIRDTIDMTRKEFKKLRAGACVVTSGPPPKEEGPRLRYDSTGQLVVIGREYSTTIMVSGKIETVVLGKVKSLDRKARVTLKVLKHISDEVVQPFKFVTVKSAKLIAVGAV